jgi:serine/threonine protein kinase
MAKALQLGRYHLLDRIAFGGMAEIYRAKTFDDEGRVHMVAVKRILSHLARDEEFIKMLVDEAKIASLMEHEAIAQVYEFCYAHGEYFIAMEYVDGKDGRTILDRCRAQRRWIPHEICAFIMMHIMRGLHQAHNQTDRDGRALNLIHRDVSPSNVICAYAGEVKLCDFGIAKATLSTVQTRAGVIKGKVKYMSPEQAMGRKLDPRTDIFSGGSVLYELLTRVPPFLAPNEMELLVLVRETRYTPVRERNPMIPPALEAIVDTAMSRRPSDRYQTADDFANALHNFLVVHAPDLTRSHLGRFVRQLFADDIEKELRALEEYVVESADNDKVGVNLIADALGPDADFSKFSPVPAGEEGEAIQRPRDGTLEAGDGGGASVQDPALSAEPTVILESSDLIQRLESTDPERVQPESEVLWKKGDDIGELPSRAQSRENRNPTEQTLPLAQRPVEPAGQLQEQPSPKPSLDSSLHTAHTVILDLEEQREALEQPATESPGRERPVAPDTKEMPALAAPEAGVDPNAEQEPEALSAKSNDDTPLEPVSFHELPTGQIEEDGSGAPRLSDADTAELEVSDLVAVAEAEKPAEPSAVPELQPVIHTETTQLLEVDDLDPDGQGVDDEPRDPGQA